MCLGPFMTHMRGTAIAHSIVSSARAESPGRHVKAERLGGREVDQELELDGLIDWQVGG
jgi:hypothetical protein